MNPDQWLATHYGHEKPWPGLDRIRPIFEPYKKVFKKVITVGGTNGKGETCLSLESLLCQDKTSVALWTSPHVVSVCERFRFHGEQVQEETLLELFEKFKNPDLSFYEFLFLIFCELCRVKKPEVVILEVGLGGRLDAVNLFDADIACVVSISRDHQKILGKSYKEILYEKIAISRKLLVTCFDLNFLKKETQKYCSEKKVEHINLYDKGVLNSEFHYSDKNKLTALCLYQILHSREITPQIKDDLKRLPNSFAARREKLNWNKNNFELIGAHNIDGHRNVMDLLMKNISGDGQKYDKVLISFSDRDIKEASDCVRILQIHPCLFEKIILTHFEHPKAMAWEKIKEIGPRGKVEVEKIFDWKDYISHLGPAHNILVIGSYYFLGEFKKFIRP